MFEAIGIIGIGVSVAAYVPQAVHIGREHCAAGVSSRAWMMWLVSGLLVGALAVHRGDLVFILLQLSTLTSAAVILYLARKYRGMACEGHAHLVVADLALFDDDRQIKEIVYREVDHPNEEYVIAVTRLH